MGYVGIEAFELLVRLPQPVEKVVELSDQRFEFLRLGRPIQALVQRVCRESARLLHKFTHGPQADAHEQEAARRHQHRAHDRGGQ